MGSHRRKAGVVALALLLAGPAALAQQYPSRPVNFIVPFAAGGAVDASARAVADPMSRLLGQPIVVDFRAGAAGSIGYTAVARAPADGYTVLVGYSATTTCSPALFSNLPWEPLRDFAPVGLFVVSPLVITTHPAVPARTMAELLAYLKQHPGKVNYGTSGIGSLAHIAAEMLQQRTGTSMTHVPFKGTGDLMPSLLSGHIQASLQGAASIKQHVQNGKLNAIAVTSAERDTTMPDVPTAKEAGVKDYDIEGWMALFVRTGTPDVAITRLAEALQKAVADPAFREKASGLGLDIRHQGPADLDRRVRVEMESCRAAVKAANIKLE